MPDTSRTTPSSTRPSTSGDLEVPAPFLQVEPLPPVRSRLISMVRQYPFLFSTFIHACLVGVIASTAIWLYVGVDPLPTFDKIPHNESGVALIGDGYQIDLTRQTLSVEWEIAGCGAYAQSTYPASDSELTNIGCGVLDRAVDVYLNSASEPTFSYDPAKLPLSATHGTLYVHTLNVFDVNHNIDSIAGGMVPFENYSLSVLAFVIEKKTNKSIPIIAFVASGRPDNFIIKSTEWRTKSNYTYESGGRSTLGEVESSVVRVTAKRLALAQAFTMCVLFVNSALAIGSAYVTLLVIFRREGVNDTVFLLPVTIVLTIPALRSLYVGSLPFGIYLDTFGFFLQMMTVAACSMILLYNVAIPSAQS